MSAASVAQWNRMAALLRDVERSGGIDTYAHLLSHGHHPLTIKSAVYREMLTWTSPDNRYRMAHDGRNFLVAQRVMKPGY